jgi:hypothetical protein
VHFHLGREMPASLVASPFSLRITPVAALRMCLMAICRTRPDKKIGVLPTDIATLVTILNKREHRKAHIIMFERLETPAILPWELIRASLNDAGGLSPEESKQTCMVMSPSPLLVKRSQGIKIDTR